MTVNLEAFLKQVDELPKTLRYERLERLMRYYEGTQYEARELDAAGYRKGSPGVYGSMARTPSWSERDPGAVWNLVGETVHELTDWTLAGDSWCQLVVADDDEAEDWLTTVTEEANLRDVVAQARSLGGATGTAAVSFSVRNGELSFDAHCSLEMWPLAWANTHSHRLAAVAKIYRGENPFAMDENDLPLVCRYWDTEREAIYERERQKDGSWVWREVESVAHGLGFCPVFWHPQLARSGAHEGCPDGEKDLGEVDEANELLCAAGCTTRRNSDDTLVVKEDPALNPGQVRKGAYNVIFARGGAEYLSQTGESARICVDLAKLRAEHVYRRRGVVFVDHDMLGKATTGELLKRLYQRTLKTAGRLRPDYARGLIVPLCKGLLEAGRVLARRGLTINVAPRVLEDAELGVQRIEQRTPGRSGFVTCVWPDAFQPTTADKQSAVGSASTATGQQQVMSRQTAVAWLKSCGLPIASVERELSLIDADQTARAEQSAAALGLGPERGAAGEVGDSEPPGDDETEGKVPPAASS